MRLPVRCLEGLCRTTELFADLLEPASLLRHRDLSDRVLHALCAGEMVAAVRTGPYASAARAARPSLRQSRPLLA